MSPFETVGLHPYLLESLTSDQIAIIVKNLGRTLMFQYHPDRSHDDARFRDISDALKKLDSVQAIQEEKEKYVLNGPGQAQVRNARATLVQLHRQIQAIELNIARTNKAISDFEPDIFDPRFVAGVYLTSLYSVDLGWIVPDVTNRTVIGFNLRHGPFSQIDVLSAFDDVNKTFALDALDVAQEKLMAALSAKEEIRILKAEIKKQTAVLKSRSSTEAKKKLASAEIENLTKSVTAIEDMLREKRDAVSQAKTNVKKTKISSVKKGYIDSEGNVILDGKNYGRAMGTTEDLLLGDTDQDRMYRVEPTFTAGKFLVTYHEKKIKAIGILQAIKIKDGKRSDAEVLEKKSSARPESVHLGTSTAIVLLRKTDEKCQNPLHTLGLLPSMVKSLDDEGLQAVIGAMIKSLFMVHHPDRGGSSVAFGKISDAKKSFEDPGAFRKFAEEYVTSDPQDMAIREIEKERDVVLKDMRPRLELLGQLKAEEARERRVVERITQIANLYLRNVMADLYGPNPLANGGVYLHHCSSMVVDGAEYSVVKDGFDVLAGGRRIAGSIRPSLFQDLDRASEAIDSLQGISQGYQYVDPIIYPGGHLVEATTKPGGKEDVFRVIGKIEKADAAVVARNMASGLEKAGSPAKPLSLRNK